MEVQVEIRTVGKKKEKKSEYRDKVLRVTD